MNCKECDLELAAGASHQDHLACIKALKHKVSVLSTCDGCGGPMEDCCIPCSVKKAALAKAGNLAVNFWEKAQGRFSGKRAKE